MILWFIQHFKIEMLVFTICVAVTIGLVVQRLPQAAIPQPRTISRYAECAKQMEEYRVWFEKVYAPPGQNWYEGWEKYQQWVRYCKEAMPNWTVPEVVEQASKAAQTRINTRQAAAPAQQVHQPTQTIQQKMESEPPRKERPLQELQTECRTKFALLKEWYDRYHTHANADLVQFHQNWQKGIEFCTKNIAGWSLPAEFAIPMESSSSPQQVSTPQPTVTPLKQQCDAGIAELEKWYR
jgi:hypothetical protein